MLPAGLVRILIESLISVDNVDRFSHIGELSARIDDLLGRFVDLELAQQSLLILNVGVVGLESGRLRCHDVGMLRVASIQNGQLAAAR